MRTRVACTKAESAYVCTYVPVGADPQQEKAWLCKKEQASCGKKVDLLEEALDGDLAFFEKEGRITHVGMVLSGEEEGVSGKQIVHASGKVRIDSLDEQGVFNAELDKYTHQLTQVRMVF